VLIPELLPGVKQNGDCLRMRINASEIGTFAQVAIDTGEAQVGNIVGAAVLDRANVLNVQSREG